MADATSEFLLLGLELAVEDGGPSAVFGVQRARAE